MRSNERYQCDATLTYIGSGRTYKTASYGAEIKFKTDDGNTLYWNTNSITGMNEGDKVRISFTVINKMHDTDYAVKNVRRIK